MTAGLHRRPRIAFLQHTNPAGYPPLLHLSRILAGRGWDVRFIGVAVTGTEGLVFPSHPNIRVGIDAMPPPGLARRISYVRWTGKAVRLAFGWGADVIYVSDQQAAPAGLAAAAIRGVPVVYHEHDHPGPADGVLTHATAWCRERLIGIAAACVAPNEVRLQAMTRGVRGRSSCHCVWNVPERSEIPPPRPRREPGPLRLFFHGSLVPGRLPAQVVHAVAELGGRATLTFVGYRTVGHPDHPEQLLRLAERLGAAARVKYLGTLPTRSDLLAACSGCDIGLAFMPPTGGDFNEENMTGASNKPFDYLAAGLGLMVSDRRDWTEMFVRPGFGVAADPTSVPSLLAALRPLADAPEEAGRMGRAGRRRIEESWNYERMSEPLIDELERLARRSRGRGRQDDLSQRSRRTAAGASGR